MTSELIVLFTEVFQDQPVLFSTTESGDIMRALFIKSAVEPDKILEQFKGGDWYNNLHSYTNHSKPTPPHDYANERVKHKYLLKHWADEYRGNALDALWERLRQGESWLNGQTDYYGRCINIAQSSGVGKTRLLHELGRRMLGMTFVFRLETESGFPSQDAAIFNYIVPAKDLPERNAQAKALSLFAGTLSTCESFLRLGIRWVP